MNTQIAAIDLGTTKVVVLAGEKNESGYRITAYREAPSKGVIRGEVVNIQNVLDSLIPLLKDIEEKEKITIDNVYVGIAGQNIKCRDEQRSRNRKRPHDLISDKEIEEMITEMANSRVESGEKILHVIPQSYNVDDHIGVENASGMTGTQIEGNYKLFIGKVNSIENSKVVINKSGLKLRELILEPIASAKAILTEDETELGTAMIDIGGGTTDLLIYHNNTICHAAVIPFGGNSITEDLRQGCGVSLRNAEQMKIQYGSCYSEYAPDNKTVVIPGIGGLENREVSFKVIASIIEARVEEIIEAVMYEIENSGFADKLGAGIVITGGGAQLTNIRQFIKIKTGYPVRVAFPGDKITHDNGFEIYKPSSSTAIGLLMMGSELNQKEEYGTKENSGMLFPAEEVESVTTNNKTNEPLKPKNKTHKKKNFLSGVGTMIGNIFENTNDEA